MLGTLTIPTAGIAVKLVVDVLKAALPKTLSGRFTQFITLILSAIAGVFAVGTANVEALVLGIVAIFTMAIATDQVLKKEV